MTKIDYVLVLVFNYLILFSIIILRNKKITFLVKNAIVIAFLIIRW